MRRKKVAEGQSVTPIYKERTTQFNRMLHATPLLERHVKPAHVTGLDELDERAELVAQLARDVRPPAVRHAHADRDRVLRDRVARRKEALQRAVVAHLEQHDAERVDIAPACSPSPIVAVDNGEVG